MEHGAHLIAELPNHQEVSNLEYMKRYSGKIENGRRLVTVDGKSLSKLHTDNPRRNVDFEWGTFSLGAIHLAEAILVAFSAASKPFAREFASQVIAELPDQWTFGSDKVEKWLRWRISSGPFRVPGDLASFPRRLRDFRERIQPDEFPKHGFLRPDDVRVSRGTDSTGDEAYYVYLVFPDRTPDKDLAWKRIEPMVSWVQDLVWTETSRLWPYVKVKRHKELAGTLNG